MKIAAAQFSGTPADIHANVRTMTALADRAIGQGAELIVFPEMALTGYELEAIRKDPDLLARHDDPRLDALRSCGIATVVNAAAPTDGPRPAIETFVFGPDGELLTTYRKQHLFEHEQEIFAAGESDGRFTYGGLRFALATCYDNHFDALTSRGAADGCEVHLASSLYGTGGGVQERASVYPGIARTTGLYVVLANHVGAAGPWTGCGGSGVWAPGGELLAEADDRTATVVTADVGGASSL
ncbi:carbon-nitrogen hydrolase family protein [Streptomyces sp. TRM66268-LWL]|uniref:Carbon-nitrogen hydrolase family protein n=1 Tax=Streptomyces polyasparticus TaxID=2767826 RepID=A0ABR7SKQ5_9ACTN|nr:carbon-nitrogen hydrolase family protein [Streptomyces polyasparticus]MBC9715182.1 carbon-nitrogen hydrolase family protein [Streptomyces polyasparticus]